MNIENLFIQLRMKLKLVSYDISSSIKPHCGVVVEKLIYNFLSLYCALERDF